MNQPKDYTPNHPIETPRGEDFEFVLGFALGVLTGTLMAAVFWHVFM